MASTGSPTVTVGDTYPPIRGCATAGTALMPLGSADLIEFYAQSAGTVVFNGTATVISPVEDADASTGFLGFNWKYDLAANDLDASTVGSLTGWLKITWDSISTPTRIEWVKVTDKITVQTAPA